jgi:putative Ca2+/H+ antiporter (TMEM165/GDT1 family)
MRLSALAVFNKRKDLMLNSSLWTVFISVFIAELGDKTQLATLMFAADAEVNKWGIFLASAGALTCSSLIATLLGGQIAQWINPKIIQWIAGGGFIIIGLWTLWDAANKSG